MIDVKLVSMSVLVGLPTSMCMACGGTPVAPQAYVIELSVKGEAASFQGKAITAQGRAVPFPDLAHTVTNASIDLCTFSRQAFLQEPLVIEVTDQSGTLVSSTVDRVACRMNPRLESAPFNRETDSVWLRPDGTVDAAFGESGNANVYATCLAGDGNLCPSEQLVR